MLARTLSATPWGIDARPVMVEVDVHGGQLPSVQIVGLADAAVKESRERVRRAIRNVGFDLPARVVVVNLAPADLRKEGNHLDLAIALALLVAYGHLPPEVLENRLISGELGLDGTVRPVRGGLALADLAARLGMQEILLPTTSAAEAAALGTLPAIGVANLGEAVDHVLGTRCLAPAQAGQPPSGSHLSLPDLIDVRGQEVAKRALEVAAAGGHNLLLVGPPGSGKTLLARRLPGILPPLTRGESIAVTKIHSLAAEEGPGGLLYQRPFRSPHASVSTAALIGGGSMPRPGEVSLAHNGVLFLDELPEFRRDTLEALRQPLEEGEVTVVRTRARLRFPARFTLVAAMNPCPCGHRGDPRHGCSCTPNSIDRYLSRISGPLLDRIDLHVEVPALSLAELRQAPGISSSDVAARVARARDLQRQRYGPDRSTPTNSALDTATLRRHVRIDTAGQALLDRAFERLGLSARALDRILKVARTLADLAGEPEVCSAHIAEAVQYRSLDRRNFS